MSRFIKKFLRDGRGLFTRETKPGITLAVYGKHPGWDDHIADFATETESLTLGKEKLYEEGIAGQINSGDWEELRKMEGAPEFKHHFVWKRGDAFLMGRMWASRDGKNRGKYPMIVCVHCMNLPFGWARKRVWKALEAFEAGCKATDSAARVKELVAATLADLKRSVAAYAAEVAQSSQTADAELDSSGFAGALGGSIGPEGVLRILYSFESHLTPYLPRAGALPENGLRACQIRLPTAGQGEAALAFWLHYLEQHLNKEAPILLWMPADETWLDATVGEPASREFYILLAPPEVLPVASDVPYQIPDDFRKDNEELMRQFIKTDHHHESGGPPPISSGPPPLPASH